MNHLMIDLETFGTGPRAVVVQLGAVVFDPEAGTVDAVSGLEVLVDPDSCLALGGEVTGATIKWWLKQSVEARTSITAGPGVPVATALERLAAFSLATDCRRTWCHGAPFDAPILEHYYRATGLPCPWKFWNIRDTRSLFEAAELLAGWRRPRADVAHTALADAVAQARDVCDAWRALREMAGGASRLRSITDEAQN